MPVHAEASGTQAKLKAVVRVQRVLPEASRPLIWMSYSVLGATAGTGKVTELAQKASGGSFLQFLGSAGQMASRRPLEAHLGLRTYS